MVWTPELDQAESWVRTWQTPLYAYDQRRAVAQIERVRAALGGAARLWYALKANANRELLTVLRPHLQGADVASEGELRQALAVGFSGADLGFTGPAKSESAHRAALRCGASVSVESLGELEQLTQVARAEGRAARLLLRVNPEARVNAFRVATGGVAGPFGLAERELPAAYAQIRGGQDVLQCEGIHVHAGSQCTSAAAWMRHATNTLALAARYSASGLPLTRVNLGGGLGVAMGRQEPLDVEALGKKLRLALEEFRATHGAHVEVALEPGRFLMAEAGCCLTRVTRRIESRGKTVVVVDAGFQAFLFATSGFHEGPPPSVHNLTRPAGAATVVNLVGPSCTPLDTLALELRMADPQPGDLLALGPAGAYGFSASPHLFLGHDVPAEVLWEGGEARCIRPRRCLADFD